MLRILNQIRAVIFSHLGVCLPDDARTLKRLNKKNLGWKKQKLVLEKWEQETSINFAKAQCFKSLYEACESSNPLTLIDRRECVDWLLEAARTEDATRLYELASYSDVRNADETIRGSLLYRAAHLADTILLLRLIESSVDRGEVLYLTRAKIRRLSWEGEHL